MAQTYYEILGVAENATNGEIDAAFKSKAREVHPDRVAPGNPYLRKVAAEAFKDLSEAKSVLLDPLERQKYDAGLAYMRGSQTSSTTPSPQPPPQASPRPRPAPQPQPPSQAPPYRGSAPQSAQKHSFWKPANTNFASVVFVVGGIGSLLFMGGISGSESTAYLGLALILLSLALLSWRHGMRPSTDAKVLGGSVFLFIFAAMFLAAWVESPSVIPKPPTASPSPQQVATSNLNQNLKAPAPAPVPPFQKIPKPVSKSNLGGTGVRSNSSDAKRSAQEAQDARLIPVPQNRPPSASASANDTTVQGLVAERNPPIIQSNGAANRSTPSDNLNTTYVHKSYFTLGSTKEEVLSIQGTPTRLNDYEWAYGLSTVDFKNGRVVSWTIYGSSPLHAKMLPSSAVSNALGYFTVGSTKDEVLAVQGTPTRISEYEWAYGLSTVDFRNDRVVSWTIYGSSPLRVKISPSSTTPNP